MSESSKPTPPVPPSRHDHVPELDAYRVSRVVERDEQDVECPGCGGSMVYLERGTGEMMMASWDPETFDSDEYKLSKTYERIERYQICERCGWRVDL